MSFTLFVVYLVFFFYFVNILEQNSTPIFTRVVIFRV